MASNSSNNDEEATSEDGMVAHLRRYLEKLGFTDDEDLSVERPKVLDEATLKGVAQHIKSGKVKNIITMAGAGISTSAGIPDFRSPGSGLYDNLAKYNLPDPQAIFEIGYFRNNPRPFFALAKELFPGSFKPTPCHYFLALLHSKKLLLRHYTQNIDGLERLAGLPEEKVVEAHGTFHTSHCLNYSCMMEYSLEWMKERIFADELPQCTECGSYVKPDIVFFGENLPYKFFRNSTNDFPKCDLLIVLGTSLVVQPFASLVDRVPETCPRLLINKEKAGGNDMLTRLMGMNEGLNFDEPGNTRDVAWLGLCDDGCLALAEELGWKEELQKLINESDANQEKKEEKPKEEGEKEEGASSSHE